MVASPSKGLLGTILRQKLLRTLNHHSSGEHRKIDAVLYENGPYRMLGSPLQYFAPDFILQAFEIVLASNSKNILTGEANYLTY